MAVTLWGKNYDSYKLRQIAGEMENQLKQIDDVSETKIIGGLPRQVRVVLNTQRLAAYGITAGTVADRLQQANTRGRAGSFTHDNQEFEVEAGRFLGKAEDLNQVVVGVYQSRPVYLHDVAAEIVDGPAEPHDYVLFANAAGAPNDALRGEYPAVTITLAKRKGTDATLINRKAEKKIAELKGYLIPPGLNVTVTRNYGETAKDKSDELLRHLFLATISVTLLVSMALGWRESGVVLLAVPVTLAMRLDLEDNRDRCGRRFCRDRRGSPSRRDNHVDLTARQICRQRRQSIMLALRPSKFDCDISTVGKSRFVETLAEGSYTAGEGVRRLGAKITDHRHCPLLRACRERPRGSGAAEKRDELATLHYAA